MTCLPFAELLSLPLMHGEGSILIYRCEFCRMRFEESSAGELHHVYRDVVCNGAANRRRR